MSTHLIRVRTTDIKQKLIEHNEDGWIQSDLAIVLGLSTATVNRIMNNKRRTLHFREETVDKICRELGYDWDVICMRRLR